MPKGLAISETAAIADRLESALARLEAAAAARQQDSNVQKAEILRLKRIESAAIAALYDLDALLGDHAAAPAAD